MVSELSGWGKMSLPGAYERETCRSTELCAVRQLSALSNGERLLNPKQTVKQLTPELSRAAKWRRLE